MYRESLPAKECETGRHAPSGEKEDSFEGDRGAAF